MVIVVEIFFISFIVMAIALLGMGVGVLFGKTNIKGSCGGLNILGRLGLDCGVCSEPCDPEEKVICQSSGKLSGTSEVCPKKLVSSPR